MNKGKIYIGQFSAARKYVIVYFRDQTEVYAFERAVQKTAVGERSNRFALYRHGSDGSARKTVSAHFLHVRAYRKVRKSRSRKSTVAERDEVIFLFQPNEIFTVGKSIFAERDSRFRRRDRHAFQIAAVRKGMGGDLRQIGSDFDARQSVTFRKSAFAYAGQAVGQDDFRQIFAAVKRLFTDGLDSAQHLEGQIRLADGIGHELSAEIEDALPRLEGAALLRLIQCAVEERLPGLQSRGQGDTFQICARKGDFGTGKVLRSFEHDAFEGGKIFGRSVVGLGHNRHAARSENDFPQLWTINDGIFFEFEEGVGQHELFHGAILHTGVFYELDPFGKSHRAYDGPRIVNQRRRAAVDDRRILHVTIGVRPVDFHPTDIRRSGKKRIDEGRRVLVRGI